MAQIFPIDFDEKLTIAQDDFILFSDSEDWNKIKKAQYSNLKWEKWDTGATWPQWPQGETWPQWPQGIQGLQGIQWEAWPKWETWETWATWARINSAAFSGNDIVFWETDWNTVTLENAKTILTWPQGEQWEQGIQWPQGEAWPKGDTWSKGDKWDKGDTGTAATISVGTTTTWEPWTDASVVNSWTSSAAVLDFTIPKGAKWDTGATGATWAKINSANFSWDDIVFGLTDSSTVTLTNAVTTLTWPQWEQWPQWIQGIQGIQWPQWEQWIQGETWETWPQWPTGATGNGISSITSSKSWKTTTVTITETSWNVDTFQIQDWQDWEWAWDVVWPNSSTDWNVALFDWVTGKLIKDSWKAFTAAGIWALADSTKYWKTLDLSIDSTTYIVTATLKDQDWTTLSTDTIDLPLESVVVWGSYDAVNKKVVLTLENGNTVEFSVADLVAWLQPEITSSNKLDADLVDDSTSTNKFVTASDKTTWNWKQDTLIAWTNIQIAADWKTISATDTKYNAATSSDLWLVKLWSDTVQSVAAWTATWATWRTYPIQVDANGLMVVNIPWENTTYNAATQSDAWLMSAADKIKLDGIATWATANTGTLTEIIMNGASQGTSWSIDLWTVLTSHQSIKTINWNTITGTWNLSLYSSISITLAAADWSSNEQTVTATWATASNIIIVSPDTSNMDDYASNKVYCSAQASNSLTFSCDTEPENDIVVNVLIMN